MKLKNIFTKRLYSTAEDSDTKGHQLALRGGYIHQTGAGTYSFSPLGLRALKNIENILRDEMDTLDCQEILMPMTAPAALWRESGRYDSVDVLLKFKNRANMDFVLNPTHEEIVCDYVRRGLESYRQLPFTLYQIQTKYRDELRVRGGLLRCREFIMKDAYSFHGNYGDLAEFYNEMLAAYDRIFRRIGLKNVVNVLAPTGDMGGKISHEFQFLSPVGEDTVYLCPSCSYKSNKEILTDSADDIDIACPQCGKNLDKTRGVEVGNIFQLGDKYSKSMEVFYTDREGNRRNPLMGCYGIGVGRALACILEEAELGKSLWNMAVAPYRVEVIALGNAEKVLQTSSNIYGILRGSNIDVVLDDGDDSAGSKFANADLLGAPIRILVSDRNLENGRIELKYFGLTVKEGTYPEFVDLESVAEQLPKLLKDVIATELE